MYSPLQPGLDELTHSLAARDAGFCGVGIQTSQ
jgi:hypothetical protein